MSEPGGTDAAAVSDEAGAAPGRPRLFLALVGRLRTLWPWLVLAALTWLGWREVREVDLVSVRALLRQTGGDQILVLLAATALNLAVFGLYDLAALGPLTRPPAAGTRWAVGVVSFAWSNFLTVGPMAGPALRFWLYRPLGVDAVRARSALTLVMAAFTLALLGWCAAGVVPLPPAHDTLVSRLILAGLAAALAGLILRALPRARFAPPSIRRWEGNPFALSAVAAIDWSCAWGVFHLALAGLHGGIAARDSLAVFFTGQLIGLISFIPGGLGSADAFWLMALGGLAGGHDRVLAALVLYRFVYYVLPWVCATLVLAGRLIPTGRRTGAFLRTAVASYTFFCGAILLMSAATPALTERAEFLRRTVPLAIVEVSHGVSIMLGFLLLVISRGLARGYRSSHRVALALFLAGALTTFLKGLDFEEAGLSLIAVVILLTLHRPFERTGRLQPPGEFLFSVAAFAIVLFTAVGYGSLPALPEISAAFEHFGYLAHGGNFLRGLFALGSMIAIVWLNFALRARSADALPDGAAIERAVAETRRWSRSVNPLLVACGDKAVFRVAQTGPPEGFIPYRTSGRFLVAYSDPVCAAGGERDLLAAFLERAAASDLDVILYQISAAFLPVAHDFGFTFFKLGEEAIVELPRFDLKGDKAKSWRHAINSVEKAGGRFEIVEAAGVAGLLPELQEVSDDWLREKGVTEKVFSVGRFDRDYMRRFPCAVVRDREGRVVAFANVLEGQAGAEISVDMMRFSAARETASGLRNVMDHLLLRLILIGKERGFTRFNLGMAPLAAVGEERRARPFEKLAHLFFEHGEQWYNYQGLRRYKEKFDPIWEPRYMAYPRPWDWPLAVTSTAVLIAGGWRALLRPSRSAA